MAFFQTDVAVIGAGPVGLFSIFACGMRGLKSLAIDALPAIGGQCTALYPEKPIYDIPGFPEVKAGDLITHLERQIEPFAPTFLLGQQVQRFEADGPQAFTLTTSAGDQVRSRSVIIAAGAGAFGPNRPPLEGIEAYEGQSVFYAVRDPARFAGKRVVIAGGGDSAVDWAVILAESAAHVCVVHRRDQFRAAPESVARMKALAEARKIDLVIPYQLSAIAGKGSALTSVTVTDMDGRTRVLNADILLPFFGLSTSLGPIAQWGLGLSRHTIAVSQAHVQTNIPGVYAIGDVAQYEGKLKLIATGFAEGFQAAHAIERALYPDRPAHQEYSTTTGIRRL